MFLFLPSISRRIACLRYETRPFKREISRPFLTMKYLASELLSAVGVLNAFPLSGSREYLIHFLYQQAFLSSSLKEMEGGVVASSGALGGAVLPILLTIVGDFVEGRLREKELLTLISLCDIPVDPSSNRGLVRRGFIPVLLRTLGSHTRLVELQPERLGLSLSLSAGLFRYPLLLLPEEKAFLRQNQPQRPELLIISSTGLFILRDNQNSSFPGRLL